MTSWLAITLLGCLGTFLIVGARADTREARDLRLIWAMAAMAAFGAVWSYLLYLHVPRALMYAFQPSLFLLGIMMAGFWLGRLFERPMEISEPIWIRWKKQVLSSSRSGSRHASRRPAYASAQPAGAPLPTMLPTCETYLPLR